MPSPSMKPLTMLLPGRGLLAALAGACLPRHAHAAADWPGARAINYVVPFTPGGTTDTIGRALAAKLGPALGQTVVVENRPGAGGGTGASYVAEAAPDGYTLLGGTISTNAINASLYKDLSYDPVKSSSRSALSPPFRTS